MNYIRFEEIDLEKILTEPLVFSHGISSFSRLFYISCVPEGVQRGGHAHRECIQYLFVNKGRVKFDLLSVDGIRRTEILKEGQSILVDTFIWLDLFFYDNAILGVYCTHKYNEDEYIREKQLFLTYA